MEGQETDMNRRNKWLAGFALGAMLACGSAAAAVNSDEIRAILVSTGGVINVYLTPKVGVQGGIIQLVPEIATDKDGKKGVRYTCYSPNIPDIAQAAPECSYHAATK
jgi:glutaminase